MIGNNPRMKVTAISSTACIGIGKNSNRRREANSWNSETLKHRLPLAMTEKLNTSMSNGRVGTFTAKRFSKLT